LKNLNLSDKVLIDIIKHLYLNPELLILDEALEKLSNENLKKILLVLNDLKEKGLSILFITHRIDDIYNFADKVTIIQNGKILITDSIDNIDKISLIKLAYTHMLVEKENNSDENFYQALKYNEAILTDLPVNLVVIDKNYKIKLVNKYAKTFFVFKNKQYKDMSFREIIPKGNKKFFKLIQDAVTKKKQMTFYQIPLTLCNSKTINNIVVYPIFDVDILIGFIIIINDITKQEKLREQITLSENLASVGLLAAGVAHEINNPLDIMSYYLEHIRFNSRDKEIQDAVHNLYEEINSIAQIVSNLITFSDKKEMSKEKFNIISLINSLIGLIEHKAEKNNITIIMNSPQEALYIEANRNEIKQVFLNIVKNSFEAMTDGGILTITISGIHYNENSNLEIIIDDTGSGIKKTDIKDIFLPFYSTRYGSDKNSGLGLSISYRIIEKYNGLITVKNKRKGCQFKIILPICT
jgi:two-component system sensor histidine kinase AtoS